MWVLSHINHFLVFCAVKCALIIHCCIFFLSSPGEEKEHSLNMETLKRSILQRQLQNLTSQSLVISCAILRLLSVPCPNSAPFSNDAFICFTDVKPLQGFPSQSFHLSPIVQGQERRNRLHLLRVELYQNKIDRAGVIEGKMLFKRSLQFGISHSGLWSSKGVIAWNGEAKEDITDKADFYSLFLE